MGGAILAKGKYIKKCNRIILSFRSWEIETKTLQTMLAYVLGESPTKEGT